MDGSGPVQHAAHCVVTVVCGTNQRDVALPTGTPSGVLVPGLIRLLEPADRSTTEHRWLLARLGYPALGSAETLSDAGILDGDVLLLQRPGELAVLDPPAGGSLRDRVEDIVTAQGRRWNPDASAGFNAWSAAVAGAAMLVPTGMSGSGSRVGVAAAVAVVLALIAIAVAHRSASAAVAALGVGCGWAGLAGWTWAAGAMVVASGVPGDAETTTAAGLVTAMAIATGLAFLLALAALTVYLVALVHVVAAATAMLASGVLLASVAAGAPLPATACGIAVTAVLLIGAAPRLALAVGGLTTVSGMGDPADLTNRIARVDRVLIGVLLGLSGVAVLGALPAALAPDGRQQLLAAGIGVGLLLRSRVFSQVPHALGPRIAGLIVLAGLWVGQWWVDALPDAVLVVGTALVGGVFAACAGLASGANPVTRARAGRFLDGAELALVVAVVVLTAGVFGLFDRAASVLS